MDVVEIVNFFFLFLLMLGLGLSVDVEKFKEKFTNPKGITIGVICQFVLMPPLAYIISGMVGLDDLFRIAFVLIGCCPGGAMSNILCFLIRADVDLSVAMTTASSFCAIFMMPLNIFLYVRATGLSDDISLDYIGIVASALLVVAGLGGGIFTKQWAVKNPEKGPKVAMFVGKAGAFGGLGVFILGLVNNSRSDTPVWDANDGIFATAFLQVLIALTLGFGISAVVGLPKPSCVSVSIETSVQNAILAMAIIAISFDDEDADNAAVCPVVYMMFSTWTNVLWGFSSWKVFGFTELPKDASCADAIAAYKSSVALKKEDGSLLEGNSNCVLILYH